MCFFFEKQQHLTTTSRYNQPLVSPPLPELVLSFRAFRRRKFIKYYLHKYIDFRKMAERYNPPAPTILPAYSPANVEAQHPPSILTDQELFQGDHYTSPGL